MRPPPPPPRWHPPVQQRPWTQPPVRPAFAPPLPPPRGFPGPPRFLPQPPRSFYPSFVPPPPPPPRSRPVVDAEQLWLDSFKRSYCSSTDKNEIAENCDEPPLRLLRHRVAQAQMLAEQLKMAATELTEVEKRLDTLSATCEKDDAVQGVEVPRLRVQRERKLAICEALKTQLEEMNAASGLLPVKQRKDIRAFAARVSKKKAYRKRAKLLRRAEASIRRAVGSETLEKAGAEGNAEAKTAEENTQRKRVAEEKEKDTPLSSQLETGFHEERATYLSTPESESRSPKSLDPETLTIGTLIDVRRAWDSYIVFPQTPGASTIPPHFVPPPPMPSAQWAVFVASSSTPRAKLCQ